MLRLLIINISSSSPAINKLCRLLPAVSVTTWSGGAVWTTPSRSQRWQHVMKPDIGSASRFLPPAFEAPVRGCRRNIAMMFGMQNQEWCSYPLVKKFWRSVCSFRQNPRIWQTDRRVRTFIIGTAYHFPMVNRFSSDTVCISMVDSKKVRCCVHFLILLRSDSPSIFLSLYKMWNINSLQKRRKITLLEHFIKLEWMHKGVMSIRRFHEGFESSRWLNSYACFI